MSILNIEEKGQVLTIKKSDNKTIFYGLNGYKKFLGYTDSYFAIHDNSRIYTFDENRKQIGSIPCTKNQIFEGIAGNNLKIQVDGGYIYIYDKYGKRVSTVAHKRKTEIETKKETKRKTEIEDEIEDEKYSTGKKWGLFDQIELYRLKDIVTTFEGFLFFLIKFVFINIIGIIIFIVFDFCMSKFMDFNNLLFTTYYQYLGNNIFISHLVIIPLLINILFSISYEDVYKGYGKRTFFKKNNLIFKDEILFLIKLNIKGILKYTLKYYLIFNLILIIYLMFFK